MREQSYFFLKKQMGSVDGQVKCLAVYQLEADKGMLIDVKSLGSSLCIVRPLSERNHFAHAMAWANATITQQQNTYLYQLQVDT